VNGVNTSAGDHRQPEFPPGLSTIRRRRSGPGRGTTKSAAPRVSHNEPPTVTMPFMHRDERVRRARQPALRNVFGTATLLAITVLLIPPGCATSRKATDLHDELHGVLAQQAAAWNAGDIEAFMEPYWQSPDLTFSSGGQVTRGWGPTLESYRRRYPSRDSMGHLTFSDLEITPFGADAALVLGRWHLDRADPVGGAFTLIFRRAGDRWLIIHDHTSPDDTRGHAHYQPKARRKPPWAARRACSLGPSVPGSPRDIRENPDIWALSSGKTLISEPHAGRTAPLFRNNCDSSPRSLLTFARRVVSELYDLVVVRRAHARVGRP